MYSDSYYEQTEHEYREAFEKVQSGEWTYREFRDFISDIRVQAKREVE